MKVLITVMVELHDGVDPVDWQENGDYGNLWGDPDVVDCELREVEAIDTSRPGITEVRYL